MALLISAAAATGCASGTETAQSSGTTVDVRALEDRLAEQEAFARDLTSTNQSLREDLAAANARLDVLSTSTTATPTTAAPAVPPLQLADPASLYSALDAACQDYVGARARDEAYDQFVAYFHQLQNQEHQKRLAGQPYFEPDKAGQACDWITYGNRCY